MRGFGAKAGVLAVVASLVAMPVAAQKRGCWEPAEYEAARIRDLQTLLMVSALQCGRKDPEIAAAYNRFVQRAKPALQEGEKHLVTHFLREGDKASYDKFTTALAGRYAMVAIEPGFCDKAKKVLEADEQAGGIMPVLVSLLNARPSGVGDVCPAKARPAGSVIIVDTTAPVTIPAPAVAPVAAPVAAPATPTADAAAAPAAPAVAAPVVAAPAADPLPAPVSAPAAPAAASDGMAPAPAAAQPPAPVVAAAQPQP